MGHYKNITWIILLTLETTIVVLLLLDIGKLLNHYLLVLGSKSVDGASNYSKN